MLGKAKYIYYGKKCLSSYSAPSKYGSSVLLIGGECVECTQPPPKKANAIYEYNVAEDEWMVREEKTTVTVFNSGASLVDGGLYGCKKKKEEKKKDGKKEKKRKETKPN